MNILKKCAFCAALLMGLLLQASAQLPTSGTADNNKPFLFSDLPDTIQVDAARLDALVNQHMNDAVQVAFSPLFSLQGKVVSAAQAEQLSSIVVKASNRLGAVFTLSRITEADGSKVFTGRILSRVHADAFELVAADGRYLLVKRSHDDLVEE